MWNHRIFSKKINDRVYYGLKEAFYDEDSGEVHSWTEDTMTGWYSSVDEMISTHKLMYEDTKKYADIVLDEDELEKQFGTPPEGKDPPPGTDEF